MAAMLSIEEIDRFILGLVSEIARGMVVDHVKNHGKTVGVADVDEHLQLVHRHGEQFLRDRRLPLLYEQPVHPR